MKKEVIFLIGPPGIGKSTFIKKIFNYETYKVSCVDEYIEEIAKRENKPMHEIWSRENVDTAKTEAKKHFLEYIKNQDNIILDNTHMLERARDFYLSEIPSDYKKVAYIFQISDMEAYLNRLTKRNEVNDKIIPLDTAKWMIENAELPSEDNMNGFDEIIYIDTLNE